MKLVAQEMPDWESRSHFVGIAAHLMRQILVDHARRHRSQKPGDGVVPVSLDEALGFASEKSRPSPFLKAYYSDALVWESDCQRFLRRHVQAGNLRHDALWLDFVVYHVA